MRFASTFDFIVIFLIILSAFLTFISEDKKSDSAAVIIESSVNDSPVRVDLKKDTLFSIEGKLGPSYIEVKDLKVRMTESPCPNKLCIKHGWISMLGSFIICAPNGIMIKIEDLENNNVDVLVQ